MSETRIQDGAQVGWEGSDGTWLGTVVGVTDGERYRVHIPELHGTFPVRRSTIDAANPDAPRVPIEPQEDSR